MGLLSKSYKLSAYGARKVCIIVEQLVLIVTNGKISHKV